ncbi:MAG TPA: AAA family ATPase [Polyangiales bacterium]|nr:AAA family ATPase [Polyangiales bacterium]
MVEVLQNATCEVQRLCEAHEAWLYQIIRDDKGLAFVAALGAPTFAHEDDAERALALASDAREALAASGIAAKAGVASGPLFYSECGTVTRRHYALVGPCINRAARMAAYAHWGQCLCDLGTRELAARTFRLQGATSHVSLDGIGSIVAFELLSYSFTQSHRAVPSPVRKHTIEHIVALANMPEKPDQARVVILEAEAGAGKSTVMRAVLKTASASGLTVLFMTGQRLQSRTSFHTVRPLIDWMLRQAADADRVAVDKLLVELDAASADAGLCPGGVESLADRLGRTLGYWLDAYFTAPALLLVDELQWSDSASWRVLLRVAEQAVRVTLVSARRIDPSTAADEPESTTVAVERLRLQPLDHLGVQQVVCEHLGTQSISGELLALIAERARGNPLFVEELSRSLAAQSAICMQRRKGLTTVRLSDVSADTSLPPTLEGLLVNRFDRLDAWTREVAKAAAILGERFELELLSVVLGEVDRREPAKLALTRLANAGWVNIQAGVVQFEHGLYPEVIAKLVPPSSQRRLHREAALYLESASSDATLGRLAYHWSAAGESGRALPLLEQAALRALRSQGYREAIELFRESLAIRDRSADAKATPERARSERLLGRALMGVTKHREASLVLRDASRSAGYRRPDDVRGLLIELCEYVLRRILRLAGFRRRLVASMAVREAMNAAVDRSAVALWLGQPMRYAQLTFALANLGDKHPPCRESAWGICSVAYLLSMTPARPFARKEFERALIEAERSGDAECLASSLALFGMALTATGFAQQAVPLLGRASQVGAELEDSFWRHRSLFMWAEALLETGSYVEAARAFDEAASLARDAEPPIYGFTRALAAVAWSRAGDNRASLERLEGPSGVDQARVHGSILPVFSAIGAEVQVRLSANGPGDPRVLQAADELEALLHDPKPTQAYFAGVHGYVGLMEARLRALETGGESDASAKQAIALFARFCRIYPGARARLELARARWCYATGRKTRAAKKLFVAERLAVAAGQLFEVQRCQDLHAAWSGEISLKSAAAQHEGASDERRTNS